jgi:hypothetical protein
LYVSFNPKFICKIGKEETWRFKTFEFVKASKGIKVYKNSKVEKLYGGKWENLVELKAGLKNWGEVEKFLYEFYENLK